MLDELIEACEARGIEVSEDDTVEMLQARLAEEDDSLFDDFPPKLDEPDPEPEVEVVSTPVTNKKTSRKKTTKKSSPEAVSPSGLVRRVPAALPGLPATHQPANLDAEVRFVVLPDGRRVPMVVEG